MYVRLRLLRDVGSHKKGVLIVVDPDSAKALIARKQAKRET